MCFTTTPTASRLACVANRQTQVSRLCAGLLSRQPQEWRHSYRLRGVTLLMPSAAPHHPQTLRALSFSHAVSSLFASCSVVAGWHALLFHVHDRNAWEPVHQMDCVLLLDVNCCPAGTESALLCLKACTPVAACNRGGIPTVLLPASGDIQLFFGRHCHRLVHMLCCACARLAAGELYAECRQVTASTGLDVFASPCGDTVTPPVHFPMCGTFEHIVGKKVTESCSGGPSCWAMVRYRDEAQWLQLGWVQISSGECSSAGTADVAECGAAACLSTGERQLVDSIA